uniref:amidohydrolase family protein n=1 Tax=Persicitalea sp. TaxID=3100273 RepID=UPI0035934179
MKILSKLLPLLILIVLACKTQQSTDQSSTAYTGATIIDGRGGEPIKDGVLLIENGRVVAVGTKSEVKIPEKASVKNVTGKFIMPGIINAHGHVGDVQGIEGGHYSAKNIIDNLATYARYGVTTVVSLGGDAAEAVALRDVNDTAATQRARLFIAGEVITGETPAEAEAVIEKNAKMGVDFMKIRVDDNLGTSPKMSEEVYRAVIKKSHELGYKIATHMYYLADAKKLLEAGSDLMAHSVRDLTVDEEFVQLIKSKNI